MDGGWAAPQSGEREDTCVVGSKRQEEQYRSRLFISHATEGAGAAAVRAPASGSHTPAADTPGPVRLANKQCGAVT